MRLTELNGFTFPVPFKVVFRHAAASRRQAENFVVCATTHTGVQGIGEGCPRSYVSGEDVESSNRFLKQHQASLVNSIMDLASLQEWILNHKSEIDDNPSAFCAIEMAILDALGREETTCIESLLDISPQQEVVRYSAVLGDAPFAAYWWLLRRYIRHGFTDFKVKLSGNRKSDLGKLQELTKIGLDSRHVRLDANNLWSASDDCIEYLSSLPQLYWGLEEPLQPRDFAGMRKIGTALRIKQILDESCTNVEDLENLCGSPWVLNLRVSRAGGILRAIEVARIARKQGIGIILGAHVGETSLLTRGTLAVLQFLKNEQIACEGAFGRHLLTSDLSREVIQFDQNAQIELQQLRLLQLPGTGLTIEQSKLKAL